MREAPDNNPGSRSWLITDLVWNLVAPTRRSVALLVCLWRPTLHSLVCHQPLQENDLWGPTAPVVFLMWRLTTETRKPLSSNFLVFLSLAFLASYSPRLLAKISPEPKGQQLNKITRLLESLTGWAKSLAPRRSGANGVETKGQGPRSELGAGQGTGGEWEAEIRPAGRSRRWRPRDGGGEGLVQELGMRAEASEGCRRRGFAPCSSKTLVCHTHESEGAKGSERSTSKFNITWATFSRLCSTYTLKYRVSLRAYPWFYAQGGLCLAAAQAHLAACAPGGCPLSERCSSLTGGERSARSAAGFHCNNGPCSHEKGTRVRGRLPCIIVPAL